MRATERRRRAAAGSVRASRDRGGRLRLGDDCGPAAWSQRLRARVETGGARRSAGALARRVGREPAGLANAREFSASGRSSFVRVRVVRRRRRRWLLLTADLFRGVTGTLAWAVFAFAWAAPALRSGYETGRCPDHEPLVPRRAAPRSRGVYFSRGGGVRSRRSRRLDGMYRGRSGRCSSGSPALAASLVLIDATVQSLWRSIRGAHGRRAPHGCKTARLWLLGARCSRAHRGAASPSRGDGSGTLIFVQSNAGRRLARPCAVSPPEPLRSPSPCTPSLPRTTSPPSTGCRPASCSARPLTSSPAEAS